MLCQEALSLDRRVERATIVPRQSGPGYRLVLGFRTERGTHVPETLPGSFPTPGEARLFALRDLGLSASSIRIATEVDALA
jgi:hypothetical protein